MIIVLSFALLCSLTVLAMAVAIAIATAKDRDRVLRGEFTPGELQDFCHHLDEDDEEAFTEGCAHYQCQLFGRSRDRDRIAQLERDLATEIKRNQDQQQAVQPPAEGQDAHQRRWSMILQMMIRNGLRALQGHYASLREGEMSVEGRLARDGIEFRAVCAVEATRCSDNGRITVHELLKDTAKLGMYWHTYIENGTPQSAYSGNRCGWRLTIRGTSVRQVDNG